MAPLVDDDSSVDLDALPRYLQEALAAVPMPPSSSTSILSLPEIRRLPTSTLPSRRDRNAQYAQLLLLRHDLTERMCQVAELLAGRRVPCVVSPELVLSRAEVYEALGYADLTVADAYVAFSVAAGEEEDLLAVGVDGRHWFGTDDEELAVDDEEEAAAEAFARNHVDESYYERGNRSESDGSAVHDRDQARRRESIAERQVLTKRDALRTMLRGLRALGCTAELPRWEALLHEVEQEIQNEHFIVDEEEELSGWTIYDKLDAESTKGTIVHGKPDDNEDHDVRGPLFGMSRRELYPWNEHEPDRMSDESLEKLNSRVFKASNGCLEVKKTILPRLEPLVSSSSNDTSSHDLGGDHRENAQLGLFALRDLNPGEIILREHSVLTAIRPHDEPLCDACAVELPTSTATSIIGSDSDSDASRPKMYACRGCEIPFCSQTCRSTALTTYHIPNIEDATTEADYPPAAAPFCPGKSARADIHELGRAESSGEPEWDLYFLLIARCVMMAETRVQNPLAMEEIAWLWGDFLSTADFHGDEHGSSTYKKASKEDVRTKHTLPYSLHHSLLLPFEFFTTLLLSRPDCAPYSSHWLRNYDWWILQTLYAKFRGVADAKESTWDGKAESAGVFGLWCLANHSCAANVTWETRRGGKERGGERVFEVRDAIWRPPIKTGEGAGGLEEEWQGIKKGEEIWNHYTDTREEDFGVRRDRLREVLGGECMCKRCIWEEKHLQENETRENTSLKN